jgi:hypothetical protein
VDYGSALREMICSPSSAASAEPNPLPVAWGIERLRIGTTKKWSAIVDTEPRRDNIYFESYIFASFLIDYLHFQSNFHF